MLHVVTGVNRHLYQAQLRQMHRQRYEFFVLGQGWNLRVRDGGEYDEGDDERAVYLLALNPTGKCRSSIRIRPADDFSYLIDHMPEWVEGDAQELRTDPALWEIARWINRDGWDTGQEVRIGMIEYLLSRNVTQAISCPDVAMADYAVRTGWRVKRLGPPRCYPEGGPWRSPCQSARTRWNTCERGSGGGTGFSSKCRRRSPGRTCRFPSSSGSTGLPPPPLRPPMT